MPVFSCNGPGCERLISVSAIAGGNPSALAEPEKFAIVHRRCSACSQRFCDRCVQKDAKLSSGICMSCSEPLADPPRDEALEIMLGGASADGALAAARIEPPGLPGKKPWWKFW